MTAETIENAQTLGALELAATQAGRTFPTGQDTLAADGDAQAGADVQDIERGAAVGRYVVLGRLGAGGMGVVYAAYDPELDRKVALKLLHPRIGGAAATSIGRARLVREAQAMARLSHPNVVAIHDVGAMDDRIWLAMEHIDGRTFGTWLKEQPRRWPEVLQVMLAAGRGLAAAHEAGLVHRDFKPDNVMIDRGGRVRVMDFGLARTADARAADAPSGVEAVRSLDIKVTQHGAVAGTPLYMAPEQWRGEDADARADQFAFCVTVWEGIHGVAPFRGEGLVELAAAVLAGEIQAPPHADAPAWLRRALARGLSVDPARRFPSMEALLAAIERGVGRGRLRRTGLALAGLALVGALVPGLRALDRSRREAACEAAGAEIAAVWDAPARADLAAAITGTGVSYAPTTLTKMTPWIDRWTQRWAEVRADVCRAGEVDGTRDPALYGRAVTCLDERREELAALLAAVRDDPRGSLSRAVRAAASLSRPDTCADWGALERRPAPPDDPATRERLAAHQREHMQIRGVLSAGRFGDALARAQELLARVKQSELSTLVPGVELTIGEAAKSAGEFKVAVDAFSAAYVDAGALGEDAVALAAATQLLVTIGYDQSLPEVGLQWAPTVDMLLRRLGQTDELPGAAYHNALATIARLQDRFDEAESRYERVLAIYEKKLGPGHPMLGGTLNNLANLLEARGDRERVLDIFARALAILEESLGSDHPHVAMLLSNQSSALYHRGEFAAALAAAERALALREQSLGADHPEVASTIGNVALIYIERREFDAAHALLERARSIQERALGPEHPRFADVLVSLALVHRMRGEFDAARAADERALAIYEKTWGPDHSDLAYPLAGLGETALQRGDPAQARPFLARAVAIREKLLPPDNDELLLTHVDLGVADTRLGDHAAARARLEQILVVTAAAPERHAAATALAHLDLGQLDLLAGAPDAAQPRFERSLALFQSRYGPDHPHLAGPLLGLAKAALARDRPLDALAPIEQALAVNPRRSALPEDYAEMQFTLARALHAADRDRARARSLAQEALATYTALGSKRPESAEIAAWLKRTGV